MRVSVLFAMAGILIVPGGGAFADLISDGGFGSGGGFSTDYVYSEDLTESGTVVVGYDPCDHHPLAASYGDHTSGRGLMLIANGSVDGDAAVWAQTVSVTPNTEYAFYYWLSAWTPSTVMPAQIRCLINGVRTGSAGFTSSTVGEWGLTLIRWNSGTNSQAEIRLVDRTGTIAGNDFALDDIGMIETEGKYLLMTDSTLGGSVDSPGEGAFLYPPGETVLLEAKCEPGYEFAGWTGQVSDPNPMIWVDMDTDRVASAVFRKLDYPVTVRASGLAMDEFTLCGGSGDRLGILCDAMESAEPNGLILGERKGLCGVTYRFPIFRPPAGTAGLSKIVVNVYGRTITSGATVWIGDTGPHRPVTGDVRAAFGPGKMADLLEDAPEPVYWLTVRINAAMGVWDVAATYVSYECPGVPPSLLRRFHDYFSIYQALECYARSPGIRDLYTLRASDESVWETVLQTTAFAEDLADSPGALQNAVNAGIDDLHDSLGSWQLLTDARDTATLVGLHSEAIVTCLDNAVSTGRACVLAYARAIGDGSVSEEETRTLNRVIADWRVDLVVLSGAMNETFETLRAVCRDATTAQNHSLRNAAEMMIRSMSPWLVARPDDAECRTPAASSYLEQVIQSLREVDPQ